jgi:hypothetical protein
MNTGKTIFAQIMDFLPLHEFRKCVHRYRGNYKVQKFSCYSTLLENIFILDYLKKMFLCKI